MTKLPHKKQSKENIDTESDEEYLEDEEFQEDNLPSTTIVKNWDPRTELGRKVKSGEIKDIDYILDNGKAILEPEISDSLLNLENDLLMIGQSKGKFGGGARRVFKQTQKKTREGNKPRFTTMAVVGNKDGYVGLGLGKSQETVPARNKAIKKAKLNVFKIRRGSGSWESVSKEPHSIPFAVTGKCGSVEITLKPAPKGKGLCIHEECQKVLEMAGIEDVWSQTKGKTKNRINLFKALESALKKLMSTRVKHDDIAKVSIQEGRASVVNNE